MLNDAVHRVWRAKVMELVEAAVEAGGGDGSGSCHTLVRQSGE